MAKSIKICCTTMKEWLEDGIVNEELNEQFPASFDGYFILYCPNCGDKIQTED
jgi:hypothetical protein